MNNIDQQFIEFIVKALVNDPDAVKIDRRIDEKGVLLELTVNPEDLGRVIGKRGATAQSLRTLLRALGTKNDARYNLKIIDNGTGDYERRAPSVGPPVTSDDSNDDNSAIVADDNMVTDVSPAQVIAPTNDQPAEEVSQEHPAQVQSSGEDAAAKTRRELDELDDLDI